PAIQQRESARRYPTFYLFYGCSIIFDPRMLAARQPGGAVRALTRVMLALLMAHVAWAPAARPRSSRPHPRSQIRSRGRNDDLGRIEAPRPRTAAAIPAGDPSHERPRTIQLRPLRLPPYPRLALRSRS